MSDLLEPADCPNCGREQERWNVHNCSNCGNYYCGSHDLTTAGKCLKKREIQYEYVTDELTESMTSTSSTYIQCPHCNDWWWVTSGGITPLSRTIGSPETPREHARGFAKRRTEIEGEFHIVDVEDK